MILLLVAGLRSACRYWNEPQNRIRAL